MRCCRCKEAQKFARQSHLGRIFTSRLLQSRNTTIYDLQEMLKILLISAIIAIIDLTSHISLTLMEEDCSRMDFKRGCKFWPGRFFEVLSSAGRF